jgi:hypothetical protein
MPENHKIVPLSPPKPAENAEKMPWCHRFDIPVAYAEQANVPGLGLQAQMKTSMTFIKCLGNQCAIWDEELKACTEKVGTKAQREIAKNLSKISELMEKESQSMKVIGGN